MATQSQVISIVGSEQFQKVVIDSNIPSIVSFFTVWCPPCQRMEKLLEHKMLTSNGYQIVKVDCDEGENAKICIDHNVAGIPTTVLYYNKAKQESLIGYDVEKLNKLCEKCEEQIKNKQKL